MQLIKIDLELNSADACLAKATKAALEVPYIDLPGIPNVDHIEDIRTIDLLDKLFLEICFRTTNEGHILTS